MSRPLLLSLSAGVIAALITGAGLTYFNRVRLAERARLQRENAALRAEAHRQVVTRSSPRPIQSVGTPPKTGPAPSQARRYRDLGQDSAQAALQTLAWAGDRGDAERLRSLIHFDPSARAMAEAYFASLPVEVRTSFGDLDWMAAALLTRAIMGAPYPETDILATAGFEPVAGDPARLRLSLPDTPKDGQVYARVDGAWKYVITEELVRAYFAENGVDPDTTAR